MQKLGFEYPHRAIIIYARPTDHAAEKIYCNYSYANDICSDLSSDPNAIKPICQHDIEKSTQVITAKFDAQFTPDTFHAFCHLKNQSIIKAAVILRGITSALVPKWSQFSNIMVIDNDKDSIVILWTHKSPTDKF